MGESFKERARNPISKLLLLVIAWGQAVDDVFDHVQEFGSPCPNEWEFKFHLYRLAVVVHKLELVLDLRLVWIEFIGYVQGIRSPIDDSKAG